MVDAWVELKPVKIHFKLGFPAKTVRALTYTYVALLIEGKQYKNIS
jgi:hypothetical protein